MSYLSAVGTKKLFWGVGFGLAAAVGLVIAGPVLSASAADHPNTFKDAQKAKATPLNAWQNDDGITSKKDVDWYRYDLPSASTVMITLGALPADYSLSLVDKDGVVMQSSLHKGKEFERFTLPLAKGRYYVKVYSSIKASSTKNYRMRFRVLPAGVFTLDQQSLVLLGSTLGSVHATFFNNTAKYQKLNLWTVRTFDAKGKELDIAHGVYDDDMSAGAVWIAPGGTRAVAQSFSVPSGTKTIIAAPVTEPIDPPAASGLTIEPDPNGKVTRHEGDTYYPMLVTNSGPDPVRYIAQVRHYTSIGDLMALGEARRLIDADATQPEQIDAGAYSVTPPLPNAVRFSVSRGR